MLENPGRLVRGALPLRLHKLVPLLRDVFLHDSVVRMVKRLAEPNENCVLQLSASAPWKTGAPSSPN